MPVPPNQSFATAIDIGTLTGYTPYTTTQDAWDGAATVSDLWYSYLPVAGDDVLEISAGGNVTDYRVNTLIWLGPTGTPNQINVGAPNNTPMQVDIVTGVPVGGRIYFQFHKLTAGNHNPSILTLRIARGQKQTIQQGDLFINDSSFYVTDLDPSTNIPYPGVVMDPTTAIPKRYALNFPAGEGVQVLTSGVVAALDVFTTGQPILFNVTATGFTVRATPAMPQADYTAALGSNQIDAFVVARKPGVPHATLQLFDANGTLIGPELDTGASTFSEVTLSPDRTTAYFVRSGSVANTAVLAIDTTSAVVSTFKAGVAGKWVGANPMTMTDGTILIPYEQTATDTIIRRYNAAGVEQAGSPYTLTGVQNALERIFADLDDPLYFWIWWQTATLNRFQKIRVSDGVIIADLSRMKFVEAVSQQGATAAPDPYSGADFSCVPIMLRNVPNPVPALPAGCPAGMPLLPVSGREGCVDTLS